MRIFKTWEGQIVSQGLGAAGTEHCQNRCKPKTDQEIACVEKCEAENSFEIRHSLKPSFNPVHTYIFFNNQVSIILKL